MKTILERVAFRKLSSHPARTSAMRDDCRHATHVSNRMAAREFAKALQLGHELQHDFLVNVVSLSALSFAIRVETEFETNDAFDYRFGMVR